MRDGTKGTVAVVTRVLVARPAPADGGAAGAPAASADAGAPAAGTPVGRNAKGYLEGEGIVWAIQYEVLARPK